MAILRGIEFAVDTNLVPAVVESDTLGVVNSDTSTCADIVTRIHYRAIGSVGFVSKKANYVVHTLSKLALNLLEDWLWMETYPPCVERYVWVITWFSVFYLFVLLSLKKKKKLN